jgi:hypothetical protein
MGGLLLLFAGLLISPLARAGPLGNEGLAAAVLSMEQKDVGGPWALLIDAGSTGSRMHLYEWAPRVFNSAPPPISKPITSERWTERMAPGISSYAETPAAAATSLAPLLDFAKRELAASREHWGTFPIFLKATAGMRELPLEKREVVMKAIRIYLESNETCPFKFEAPDQARVIAGEEEAAYAWAGVNFVTGALLDSAWGTGDAAPARSFGTLEMGGASAQIAFYKPVSILANLFKLQVGGAKHWNIYAHSYLQFGRVSGRARMWAHLAESNSCFTPTTTAEVESMDDISGGIITTPCRIVDACLARGLTVQPLNEVTNLVEVHPSLAYRPVAVDVTIQSIADAGTESPTLRSSEQFDGCLEQIASPLGFSGSGKVEQNRWCNYTFPDSCAFAGEYQAKLPGKESPNGKFMLIGGYVTIWEALGLNSSGATLAELRAAGKDVCALDIDELNDRFKPKNAKKAGNMEMICFMSAFAFSMLHFGHGFELDREFSAVKTMMYEGAELKVGWQLGSILYEINALPWTFDPDAPQQDTTEDQVVAMMGAEAGSGDGYGTVSAFAAAVFFAALGASVALRFGQHKREGQRQVVEMVEISPLLWTTTKDAPPIYGSTVLNLRACAAAPGRGNSRKNEVALEIPNTNTPPRAGSLLP